MDLHEIETQREAAMNRLVDSIALTIVARPYTQGDVGYSFEISDEGKVAVCDDNFDKPQKLANWIFTLTEMSEVDYEPADATQLTLEVQRRLTTEQGDFTTLMILDSLLPRTSAPTTSNSVTPTPQMKPAGKKHG